MDHQINALVPSWTENQGPWAYAFENITRPKSKAYDMLSSIHMWMLDPKPESNEISTM